MFRKVKGKIRQLLSSPEPISDAARGDGHPTSYFIRTDYQSRSTPEYFPDTRESSLGKVYQPDVYRLAAAVGRFGSAITLVDVGCGQAEKLVALAEHFRIVGIDYGENIEYCQSELSFGQWLNHDFESAGALPLDGVDLSRSVVVCADVIEHLVDPTHLLLNLKKCTDEGAVVVLSTPERVLVQGRGHRGPPPNRSHVREWSMGELRRLLESFDFEISFMGLTADNDDDREMSTIVVFLGDGR